MIVVWQLVWQRKGHTPDGSGRPACCPLLWHNPDCEPCRWRICMPSCPCQCTSGLETVTRMPYVQVAAHPAGREGNVIGRPASGPACVQLWEVQTGSNGGRCAPRCRTPIASSSHRSKDIDVLGNQDCAHVGAQWLET